MKFLELVVENDISEYALSKKSGVPYSTISDLCRGRTDIKKCNVETVYKLAKALNTTVEELVEDKPATDNGEMAELDLSIPPITKFDYYKSYMKYRKNAILRSESAMEYLGLTDGNFSTLIKVYSTTNLPAPFIVKRVKNFKDIDYQSIDGVLVTSVSKSFDDMVEDKEADKQILDQAMNNYYYKNNNSFDGINISEKNLEQFNKEKEIALEYYDN